MGDFMYAEITAADKERFKQHLERRRFGRGNFGGNPRRTVCLACGKQFESRQEMKAHRDEEHRY